MQIIELDELVNIIDELIIEEEISLFNEESIVDFCETVLEIMDQYIIDNPTFISEPTFHDDLKDYIIELMSIPFENEFFWNPNLKEEMDLIIDEIIEIFFDSIIPYRSFPDSIIINELSNKTKTFLEKQIQYLRSKPQADQRTKEWYEFRNNLITASNAYKAFESESVQNQLIYEKCNITIQDINSNSNSNSNNFINVNTTLHWGQKYEKVSVMIYEDMYKTTIEDFGCIQHDKYKFLGASPDGINVDKRSPRYGRMLEIKNIINREIDGIPKKEYWIQMQLQMEVCNLDECDFLETKFIEYQSYNDFCNDTDESCLKGLIMYFAKNDGNPFYVYKPINMNMLDSEKWEEVNLEKYSSTMTWIKNCYWKLEKLSCVLVLRNKEWFANNVSSLQNIWSIIESERINGFEHRAPNKRSKVLNNDFNLNLSKGCLIIVNKEDNKTFINNDNDNINNKLMINVDLDLDIDFDVNFCKPNQKNITDFFTPFLI